MIALATKDDEVDGHYQPRLNVIHEIGLAQEKLRRIIYLKEEGCQFPSNVAPKIWESFTQDNMENAFAKVVKELRAFGVIS
jgi:predicted nucleotide-binding protein